MKLNTLLIGLGNIGMIYDKSQDNNDFIQTHAKAINLHPNFNLIGGIDISDKNRRIFEKRYRKTTSKNILNFSYKEQIDLVIIATPTETHLAIVENTLKFLKPKMILCEKPLSYNYEDAKNIINLCNFYNTKLFVNYIRRSNPGVLEIKKNIDTRIFMPPFRGTCWYSKGLYNNGSHFINLLEFWLGEFVKIEVFNKGRLINEFDNEPEFLIQFSNGDVVFRAAWEEFSSFYEIQLLCKSGILKYSKGGDQICFYESDKIKKFEDLKRRKLNSNLKIYQYDVLEDIKKEYQGLNTTICKGQEALSTQRIIYLLNKQLQN